MKIPVSRVCPMTYEIHDINFPMNYRSGVWYSTEGVYNAIGLAIHEGIKGVRFEDTDK